MSWKKLTLTTAGNKKRIAFVGKGSIYAEGTFGAGVVEVHIVFKEADGAAASVSTGFIDDAIDGVDVKSKEVPSGHYELVLSGSTGATVDVYCNDQKEGIFG